MMDLIRNWLIGITVAAIISAMADCLMPDGAAKKIGKLTGGLLIMIAVLQPVVGLEYETMSSILVDYQINAEEYSEALKTENTRLIKTIIEEQTAAYIQDKAAGHGIECVAEVSCRADENANPYLASIIVYGELTQEQVKELSHIIEGDLAVSVENQQYERTEAR